MWLNLVVVWFGWLSNKYSTEITSISLLRGEGGGLGGVKHSQRVASSTFFIDTLFRHSDNKITHRHITFIYILGYKVAKACNFFDCTVDGAEETGYSQLRKSVWSTAWKQNDASVRWKSVKETDKQVWLLAAVSCVKYKKKTWHLIPNQRA